MQDIITFTLRSENGPSGHPLVEFRGPYGKMCRLLAEYDDVALPEATETLQDRGRVDSEGRWCIDLDVVDGMEGAAHMVAATLP